MGNAVPNRSEIAPITGEKPQHRSTLGRRNRLGEACACQVYHGGYGSVLIYIDRSIIFDADFNRAKSMSRTRTLSDDTVLNRAISVFWQNGYAGTSMRDLTRATELSTAALYHRFTDKDGMFVQALRRYADDGLVERLARLSASADPLGAIGDFLNELVAMSLADPQHRGCLLVNTALDGAAMSNAARDLVRARLGEVEVFFAQRLECALTAGALDPATDIAANATALLGTVFAIRVMARLDPNPQRLRILADHAIASLPKPQKLKSKGRSR